MSQGINLLDLLSGKNKKQKKAKIYTQPSNASQSESINFDQQPSSRKSSFKRSSPSLNAQKLLFFILSLILVYGAYYYVSELITEQRIIAQNKIKKLNSDIKKEKERALALNAIKQTMNEYDSQVEILKERLRSIQSVNSNRNLSTQLIDLSSQELPNTIWFKKVTINRNKNSFLIEGYTLSTKSLTEYVQSLQKISFFPEWFIDSASKTNAKTASSDKRIIHVPESAKEFKISAKIEETF